MFTLCARVIAGLVALMLLLPALQYVLSAICSFGTKMKSPDIGAFADALTMNIDDVDEAIRQRRTAVRVALSAAHSAVFEPLTYHTTPATIQ